MDQIGHHFKKRRISSKIQKVFIDVGGHSLFSGHEPNRLKQLIRLSRNFSDLRENLFRQKFCEVFSPIHKYRGRI